MPKKTNWWSQKAFSSNKSTATTPVRKKPAKVKIEKCPCGSGKSKLICDHKTPTPRGRAKPAPKQEPKVLDKPVHRAVSTPKFGTCSACGCYEYGNGRCRNAQCSRH